MEEIIVIYTQSIWDAFLHFIKKNLYYAPFWHNLLILFSHVY